ncbi:hypothetical protein F5Y10DRAFT_284739 [Nemania abortiva]|nr:hypothetical protein F5Y10DRAFT_284739 [Nemania abortiva]
MSTSRERYQHSEANQASRGSLDQGGVAQDARESHDTNSEPPLLSYANFSTAQRRWGSNNPYSHIMNAYDIRESLAPTAQQPMSDGTGFNTLISSKKDNPQPLAATLGETANHNISQEGELRSLISQAVPKPPLANSGSSTQKYFTPGARSLLQSNTPSEKSQRQIRESPTNTCESCEEQLHNVWFCNICTLNFCQICWDAQVVHKKLHKGTPHEKTSPDTAAKVHNVLSPPTDELVRSNLYRADASTAWFGIERPDDSSAPIFHNYGRFTELMEATDPIRKNPTFVEEMSGVDRDRRTPSLVSFVGQTGAGKSSLIKLLIDFAVNTNASYSSPVIGPRGAHIPTSEDVHLYLDPKTADSEGPILYADCEGLEGGEREPLGAIFKRKRRQDHTSKGANIESDLLKPKVISERELLWADGPRTRSREFAVTNLYPRVLYTFSDVIVFVLRNPRVIEHVFERLVQWAVAAIETSSNQPVLPHAIIALNASEHDIDDKRWNVLDTTDSILHDLGHTVNYNIIRLPAEGRPKLMEEQVRKLYDGTLTACISARYARYQARMLLDVEDLNDYLQEAFNHYSNTLESPFDFVQASSRNSPIPPDFGGNILKLALDMMTILKPERHIDARRIFYELSYMVASCIMLDSARHNNKGSASQILPKYISHLDDAVENFCDQYWPCEFINPKTGVRCVNVRSGHTAKGHQSADGRVFAAGNWVSNFSFQDHRSFRDWVYCCLLELLRELTTQIQESGEAEKEVAARIHKTMILSKLFSHAKHSDESPHVRNYFMNNTACFCCLFGQAEHCLPCGHILCIDCVNTYGYPRGSNWIELLECPFLCHRNVWAIPCAVPLKPKLAGIRLVTLDGGGIRGIVELEVLRQIEMQLGGIPIQCFIDLIVGTSTGGLVALGLASMNWTVDQCIEQFEGLCNQAFTRRTGSTLPLVGHLVDHHHHSKYQTKTLESALKEAYTDDMQLFGGERLPESSSWQVKVAVTATALAGNKTYVLSNYNGHRESQKSNHYHFQRPQLYSTELKIWEAARATSAAPRYFKSFHHEASQKTYIDGAVLHNNPVRIADSERKILWPDNQVPDLFLSIGTGSSPTLSRVGSEKMSAARKGIVSHTRYLYGILRSTLEQTLDCEKAWDDYMAGVTTSLSSPFLTSKFVRINPDVGEIPALDDKAKMLALRTRAVEALSVDPRIPEIAKQLIASTFYFEHLPMPNIQPDGTLQVQGKIRCRLLHPSREMCRFGEHLLHLFATHRELKFVIHEDTDIKPLAEAPLTIDIVNGLIRNQGFDISRVRFFVKNRLLPTQIYLYFGQESKYPISGFPQCFTLDSQVTSPTFMIRNVPSNSSVSRYTHGSRRRKGVSSSWKPPDLRTAPSLSNLRDYYSHPDRILGHDIVKSEEEKGPNFNPEGNVLQQNQTSSPSREHFATEPRRRERWNVREAFSALLGPLWMQRPEAEIPQSEGLVAQLDDLLLQGLQHEAVYADFPNLAFSLEVSPGMLAGLLQQYNVSPEEYGVYMQWISLLQPNLGQGTDYWLPRIETDTSGFAHSSSPGEIYELNNTPIAFPGEIYELNDTPIAAPENNYPFSPNDITQPVELP